MIVHIWLGGCAGFRGDLLLVCRYRVQYRVQSSYTGGAHH